MGYKRVSKIPDHLRPFHRSPLTTEPVFLEDNTFAFQISPPVSVELCPPHWRLPPKRSLRRTLKAIVLKEWPGPSPQTPRRSTSRPRPFIMRMKDSDDYITARAANPRTGLISPSVGSLTPRLQDTPDSPGEALYIKKCDLPLSPTPDTKERPGLRRANEGRKISYCNKLWRADENGWLTEVAAAAASPRVTKADVEAGMLSCKSRPLQGEDALIVHMPSAQEPQPYAYPGYSAKQIEAVEVQKRKVRPMLNAEHHRQISVSIQGSSGPGLGKAGVVSQAGYITVAKRRIAPHEMVNADFHRGSHGGAEVYPTTFAPFNSPRTPVMRSGDHSITELHTAKARRHPNSSVCYPIHRKPLATDRDGASPRDDGLKNLPRIALVHPTLAALPQTHPHRRQVEHAEVRKCSFGCIQDSDGNSCINQRTPAQVAAPSPNHSFFDQVTAVTTNVNAEWPASEYDSSHEHGDFPQPFELFATAIISIIDACRHVILPRTPHLRVFDVLRADDQSPQQKVDAVKYMLSTAGQALMILGITATLWYVGSTLMYLLKVILWPVVVPFKILRWLGGGS